MKLRNKITSEIKEAEARDDGIYLYSAETEQWFKYDLPLLAECWEYYTYQEPLIKDEKIRKAIRAWAEANYISKVSYENGRFEGAFDDIEFSVNRLGIEFGKYTIAELCGRKNG